MCAPLMKAARGEARNTTSDATSCGSQMRWNGMEEMASSWALAWSTFLSRANAFSRPDQRRGEEVVVGRRRDLTRGLLELLLRARRDHDACALARKLLGDRARDALARAGHERRLYRELEILLPASSSPGRSSPVAG